MTWRCRVCGELLPAEPLLQYRNMPGAAQFMPTAADLATERGVDLAVSQCDACGLVQLLGEPVAYYRDVVRATAVSEPMRIFRLAQFRDFAARHGLVGRKVLEVGCGCGEYLTLLRQAGLDAQGLENSERSVGICRAGGLPAHQGFIGGVGQVFGEAPYDGFAMLSFLEHLPSPVQTLRGIAAHLSDGAPGLVEVPNFEMIVRDGLFSEFIGDHLTYFTASTLQQTLALSGFELLACQPVWQDYILSATVRKRRSTSLAHLADCQRRVARDVAAFLDRPERRGVAIWGAGHQALAVISLLSLQDRVRYVVDSAPFKQNCFTPASHLPIRAPQALRDDPVDAVLVIAGSFSDEVAAIVRRQYDPALHIGILTHTGVRVL